MAVSGVSDQRYRDNLKAKGADLKIGNDHSLAQYIERAILEDKRSPAAVLGEIRRKGLSFATMICTATLYSYIDKGIFLNLTNKALVVKGKRKRRYRKVKPTRPPRGESIEKRPSEVEERQQYGHWEMDCIEGKKKTRETLLMFTERKTRMEIAIKMPDQTAKSVVEALDALERKFGDKFPLMFLSITVDNGSEFADCEGMERSVLQEGKRTKMYYCHPYSSWERGSNENGNKMMRRLYPKGTDFREVSAEDISRAERWINEYPRKIFGYGSANEAFTTCLASL